MLILLTHANHLYSDRKQVRKMQPYPPLQTLIVAALLRQDGHEVAFHDVTFNRDFEPALETHRPGLVAVVEDNFNFLTKMCLQENRKLAFEIADASRQRGIPAIVNSSDATGNPQAYLEAGFSHVLLGEVESVITSVCRNWSSFAPGLHGGFAQATLRDLDTLPMPAWDLIHVEAYRSAWKNAHGYFSLNLAASRGCPYQCNWCAKPIHGDAYRAHSPDRVATEIECVHELFRPDHLWFADDIFGLSPRWVRDLAASVARTGVRIPFKMQSRCDLMARDTVTALADAGCAEVWMGAESGSQRVLDSMQKGIAVEQIGEACENLRRHGIRPCLFLQFGYPGEEWADIEATIRMVRDARPVDIGVSVSYPLPGTRFHEITAQKSSGEHWRDSDDVAGVHVGQFPSSVYRALADALHLEVREGANSAAAAWEQVESLRCACC